MTALRKKLVRELWGMRGQALAIAFVIAGGVATFVMSLSTLDSLQLTQTLFYAEYRFADVFVSLKRAPKSLAERIRDIPGVDRVDTRVAAGVNIDLAGYADPVTGLLISVDGGNEGRLNDLYLREGRFVDPLSDTTRSSARRSPRRRDSPPEIHFRRSSTAARKRSPSSA